MSTSTETRAEPTARPWRVEKDGTGVWVVHGDEPPNISSVARMRSVDSLTANANLIVRAVNSHDKLVEALERLVHDARWGSHSHASIEEAAETLRLAKGDE